jgi:hypothetical protein
MKRVIGLVAVLGLTLTAVTSCSSSDDSASTEASGVVSVTKDCATIDDQLFQWSQDNQGSIDKSNRSADTKKVAKRPAQDNENSEPKRPYQVPYVKPYSPGLAADNAQKEVTKELKKLLVAFGHK